MKHFMAATAFLIGVIFLLAAGVGVVGALSKWGPHVNMSSESKILAAVAGPIGLLFLGIGWATVAKREDR